MIMKTQTDCQKWAEERVEKKLEKSRTPGCSINYTLLFKLWFYFSLINV